MTSPATTLSPPTATPKSEAPKQSFIARWAPHAVWIALTILVFAPTVYWLWQRWTMSVWHNIHGMFIPLIAILIIRHVLRADSKHDTDQSAWGFLLLAIGLAMVALDSAIRTQLLAALGLVICLPGFSLLLLGWRRTKALAFVWLLFPLMLPIPAAFIEGLMLLLRRITAVGAEHMLSWLGVPVMREGTYLYLAKSTLNVTDACSGFAALYASFALALILAYFTPSWPRRLLTIALAFPVAVSCNILRNTVLALAVQHWGGQVLDTAIHPASGMVMFAAAAALLTMLSGVEKRRPAA